MEALQTWMQRFEDQNMLVHLAGACGAQYSTDWVIPFASDIEFADIMINKVNAPTRNRTFYANDATSPGDIGSNDALTLQDIDRIVSSLRESSVPLAPIKIKGDDATWNVPMWAMFVTERRWLYLKSRTGQTQWNEAANPIPKPP